jgi:putative oxidoreductase
MSVVTLIARILLGVTFTLAGVMPLFAPNPPPMPGLVGVINSAFYQSHWMYVIAFAQFVAGVLLLTNRFVPVALIILAGFMYNSLAFHSLVMPSTLPIPVAVVALWLIVCLPYRAHFAALFNAKPIVRMD